MSHRLKTPFFVGAASVVVGLILVATAVFLVRESKGLLLGESVNPDMVKGIRNIARSDEAVCKVYRILSMHLSPEEVLLNIDVEFLSDLSASQIAEPLIGSKPTSGRNTRSPSGSS